MSGTVFEGGGRKISMTLPMEIADLPPHLVTGIQIGMQLIASVVEKELDYESSWKRRGGRGAFHSTVRKWDRIEAIANRHADDVFEAMETNDGGVLDDIGDLIGYLLLWLGENEVRAMDAKREGMRDILKRMASEAAKRQQTQEQWRKHQPLQPPPAAVPVAAPAKVDASPAPRAAAPAIVVAAPKAVPAPPPPPSPVQQPADQEFIQKVLREQREEMAALRAELEAAKKQAAPPPSPEHQAFRPERVVKVREQMTPAETAQATRAAPARAEPVDMSGYQALTDDVAELTFRLNPGSAPDAAEETVSRLQQHSPPGKGAAGGGGGSAKTSSETDGRAPPAPPLPRGAREVQPEPLDATAAPRAARRR